MGGMDNSAPSSYYDNASTTLSDDVVRRKLATRSALTPDSAKLILAMVGLPVSMVQTTTHLRPRCHTLSRPLPPPPPKARGKSVIAHKLTAFLNWSGHSTKIFNAGQLRRRSSQDLSEVVAAANTDGSGGNDSSEDGTGQPQPKRRRASQASYFSNTDPKAKAEREAIAMQCKSFKCFTPCPYLHRRHSCTWSALLHTGSPVLVNATPPQALTSSSSGLRVTRVTSQSSTRPTATARDARRWLLAPMQRARQDE